MAIKIVVGFKKAGVPEPSLSPTIDIYETDGTQVVTAAAMVAIASGGYFYDFTAVDETLDYFWEVDGGATLSSADRFIQGTNPVPIASGDSVRLDSDGLIADTITAAKIATDAIGADELATSGVNKIRDSILSDSTAFAGANIDAAISTRAAATAECKLGVTFDTAGPEVRLSVSLVREGIPITSGLLSAAVSFRNPDGTELFSVSTGATADALGQFDLTSATALVPNTAYFANVTITDGTGAVLTRKKTPTAGS